MVLVNGQMLNCKTIQFKSDAKLFIYSKYIRDLKMCTQINLYNTTLYTKNVFSKYACML